MYREPGCELIAHLLVLTSGMATRDDVQELVWIRLGFPLQRCPHGWLGPVGNVIQQIYTSAE